MTKYYSLYAAERQSVRWKCEIVGGSEGEDAIRAFVDAK